MCWLLAFMSLFQNCHTINNFHVFMFSSMRSFAWCSKNVYWNTISAFLNTLLETCHTSNEILARQWNINTCESDCDLKVSFGRTRCWHIKKLHSLDCESDCESNSGSTASRFFTRVWRARPYSQLRDQSQAAPTGIRIVKLVIEK